MVQSVRVFAHRGFAGLHTENTLEAFRAAAEFADAIELDVQQCATGEIVVFHDLWFDDHPFIQLTGGVWEHSLEEIRAHSLPNGEPIPTLPEVFEVIPEDVLVNVELKAPGRADFTALYRRQAGLKLDVNMLSEQADLWSRMVGRVVKAVQEGRNPVLLSSFYEPALQAARIIDEDISRAVVVADDWQEGFAIAADQGCEAIHPWKMLVFNRPGQVQEAHRRRLSVNAWTVRMQEEADRLVRHGVNGVFADYPVSV